MNSKIQTGCFSTVRAEKKTLTRRTEGLRLAGMAEKYIIGDEKKFERSKIPAKNRIKRTNKVSL